MNAITPAFAAADAASVWQSETLGSQNWDDACDVQEGQYWRLEKLRCFDEVRARRFPEFKRDTSYSCRHEQLPPQDRKERKEVGWTKGQESAKSAGGMVRSSIVQSGCTRRAHCRRIATFCQRLAPRFFRYHTRFKTPVAARWPRRSCVPDQNALAAFAFTRALLARSKQNT